MTDSTQDGPERPGTGSRQHSPGAGNDGLLAVAANLSRYHREHEKYYSEAPLTEAIALQRAARTLIALAERWTAAEPAAAPAPSPFAGTPDLNDDRAIETSGVLFMEGGGEPAEITRIKSELQTVAASSEQSGSWLAAAMEASWAMAEALLCLPPARRPPGRTAQDHRQQLAERGHRAAHRPLPPAGRRGPGPPAAR